MQKSYIVVLFLCFYAHFLSAQFQIVAEGDAESLAEHINTDYCSQVCNEAVCGNSGYFNFYELNAGNLFSGAILSTGDIATALPPNVNGSSGTSSGCGEPDAWVQALFPDYTDGDFSYLSYEITPSSNSIDLNVFVCSEEFPEFTDALNSDQFGVFVSCASCPEGYNNSNVLQGLGPAPSVMFDTQLIDTDNSLGYDGCSNLLLSGIAATACETYTIDVVIVDIGDVEYDSAIIVGMEEPIDGQGPADIFANNDDIMVEGCDNGSLVLYPDPNNPFAPITFTVGGTATYGLDYYSEPDISTITSFPTNGSEIQIEFFALYDGILDPNETIEIILPYAFCPSTCGIICDAFETVLTITIQEESTYNGIVASATDATLCSDECATITISTVDSSLPDQDGYYLYNALTDNLIASSNEPEFQVCPVEPTVYYIVAQNVCGAISNSAYVTVNVTVDSESLENVIEYGPYCSSEEEVINIFSLQELDGGDWIPLNFDEDLLLITGNTNNLDGIPEAQLTIQEPVIPYIYELLYWESTDDEPCAYLVKYLIEILPIPESPAITSNEFVVQSGNTLLLQFPCLENSVLNILDPNPSLEYHWFFDNPESFGNLPPVSTGTELNLGDLGLLINADQLYVTAIAENGCESEALALNLDINFQSDYDGYEDLGSFCAETLGNELPIYFPFFLSNTDIVAINFPQEGLVLTGNTNPFDGIAEAYIDISNYILEGGEQFLFSLESPNPDYNCDFEVTFAIGVYSTLNSPNISQPPVICQYADDCSPTDIFIFPPTTDNFTITVFGENPEFNPNATGFVFNSYNGEPAVVSVAALASVWNDFGFAFYDFAGSYPVYAQVSIGPYCPSNVVVAYVEVSDNCNCEIPPMLLEETVIGCDPDDDLIASLIQETLEEAYNYDANYCGVDNALHIVHMPLNPNDIGGALAINIYGEYEPGNILQYANNSTSYIGIYYECILPSIIGENQSTYDIVGVITLEKDNCAELFLTVALEGMVTSSNNGNLMSTDLYELDLIPSLVPGPYAVHPVDWVIVELRDPDNPSLVHSSQLGIVTANGKVFNAVGSESLIFDVAVGDFYHIGVIHRNHLDVLSTEPVEFLEETIYDFTSGVGQALGVDQQNLVNGAACMIAGDFNGDQVINVQDGNMWMANNAIIYQYVNWDADGNAIVNVADYNLWIKNVSKIGAYFYF